MFIKGHAPCRYELELSGKEYSILKTCDFRYIVVSNKDYTRFALISAYWDFLDLPKATKNYFNKFEDAVRYFEIKEGNNV
jgi:predicted HAD superfamily phosphohydrolase YqeG